MSQDHKVLRFDKPASNKDKIERAYILFSEDNHKEALLTICKVDQSYYNVQFHKDISRALLCANLVKQTQDPILGIESEFYLVVYRLTKFVTENRMAFTGSGHFYDLRLNLFKGLTGKWR